MDVKVFKTRIDNYTKKEIFVKINVFLDGNKTKQIATVNSEFLLEAKKNEKFRNILNKCDLNIPDSSGINIAFWKKKEKMKYRYPGVDLTVDILKELNKRNMNVFLLTSQEGLTDWQEVAYFVNSNFPNIKVKGANCEKNIKNLSKELADKMSGSDVVLCNFGAPYQEMFLFCIKYAKIQGIKLVIGIGGTFDFLTQKLPRAPIFMQKIGIEWLYRVYVQPWRWKRVINAVIVFPFQVLISKE